MAAKTFPRFLELPQELQTKIWSHAITATIPRDALLSSNFGTSLTSTEFNLFLCAYDGFLHGPLRRINLRLPRFVDVLQTSRSARLTALEWWRQILAGCEVEQGSGMRTAERSVRDLDELIKDLRIKLYGENATKAIEDKST